MSRLSVISSFASYEMKRAIARRKVLILIGFIVLLSTLPYYGLMRIESRIPAPDLAYLWVVIVFLGPLFLNFTAILIAAGAMSEEYEQGTAELLLSKPVRRSDYFAGKFLGGFVLFLVIEAIDVFLNIASAYAAFGPQQELGLLPGLFVAQSYAGLLFYSLAFMLGEVLRRSSIAYIFSSALFFASFIIGTYLQLIYAITNNAFYQQVQFYLPTTSADSLPQKYVLSNLPSGITFILNLAGGGSAAPPIAQSILQVFLYSAIGLVIAAVYFSFADISRRVG